MQLNPAYWWPRGSEFDCDDGIGVRALNQSWVEERGWIQKACAMF